ncbi:hypothetical protein [Streptomyces sp. CAU 1734]|uniref:hypothetical protein n=1 Tax=Streptomyces sp. CAU 1734 TaxID=3140360 RepID=UPI00326027F2
MTGPLRPVFREGRILAAADLSATVEYARAAAARHARYLHEWGIAEGLALVTADRTDPLTGARRTEVSVSAGTAIDATGREIVVTEPAVLSESEFEEVNGADQPTDEPYPVFLGAVDRDPPGSPGADSCGVSAGGTRVEETYQILFGRLGDELLTAGEQPPGIADAPAVPPARRPVLLGYVRWTDGRFTGVETTARGVAPRYAGVRADTVSARAGALVLRTEPAAREGTPVIVLSGGDPPGLVFGLYRPGGTVAPLMTVAANGNLTIEGSFTGRMPAGSTQVISGTATDGMLLPLPPGITPEQVADGRVVLHILVTPRIPPAATATTLVSPVESGVDDARRVRCRVRLFDPAVPGGTVTEQPGAVDFCVLATASAGPVNGGDGQ